MPNPLVDRPCDDCGMMLPYKTRDAGSFLYGGGSISVQSLADSIEESVRRNDRAKTLGQPSFSDEIIVNVAIEMRLDGTRPEDFAAAVRHWGDMGHDLGSECEQIQHAQQCHEPTPDHGGWDDKRPRECTLEADHGGEHRFAYEPIVAR